jgi:F0F1-type ATP synthase membrane subunit a
MGIKMFLYILIGNWIGTKTAVFTDKEYWEPLLTMIGVGLAMYTIISDVIRKSN